MSDNEDLLGDDLGDQSLADYNLGNEEEEQLLADDYDNSGPQNVPTSIGPGYRDPMDMVPQEYPRHVMDYNNPQPIPYAAMADTECVVPNITVEVPNMPVPVPNIPDHSTYAPYEPPVYEEHAVPPAIPAAPIESPQIVPSDVNPSIANGDLGGRERFVSERPAGAQRLPQVRDIPDSLDKVVIPHGGVRGRTSWRNPQRYAHPYRRHHVHRGNFNPRPSFPPPQIRHNPPMLRPEIRPDIRPEIHPDIRPEMHRDIPEVRPDIRPEIRHDRLPHHPLGPEMSPERPYLPPDMQMFRPERPFNPRFQYRPDERPPFGPRPNFDPRPMYYRPNFPPRMNFAPPIREIVPNSSHMPQVTIRQQMPIGPNLDKKLDMPREPEVRMLPVSLPPHLPPGGLAGKKVLINPHFKGNFQPPVEGLPVYIPTRIQKSPQRPISPTIENKFGPVKDIDDAAERFIAEQRNALARAAVRKYQARRSPQRYIENTTIEIENDLAPRRRSDDDDLLRRQEEFINANRAGLRRRMRSPSPAPPARRSPSPASGPAPAPAPAPAPRRSPDRRRDPPRHDEDSEYKRRLREQESLRERVLRAKEVRRRKNAVALHKQLQDKEREAQEQHKEPQKSPKPQEPPKVVETPKPVEEVKPDTTRNTPEKERVEKVRERSLVKNDDVAEVNSTCEALTPPHMSPSPPPLTPPLPRRARSDSDDDLDLILGDIDGILSDDDEREQQRTTASKPEPVKEKSHVDLRSKLPPKASVERDSKPQRQKIVFNEDKEDRKKRDKSPPRRAVVTSSTKVDDSEPDSKKTKKKSKLDLTIKSKPRIVYNHTDPEPEKEKDAPSNEDAKKPFTSRRVILQRTSQKDKSVFARVDNKPDHTQPQPSLFSRAVRTALKTSDKSAVANTAVANVDNLPFGMTDTRLKTLAGTDVQSLVLDKEERSAKITFKNAAAAETFKKKFNNKMVAASRLSVTLQ